MTPVPYKRSERVAEAVYHVIAEVTAKELSDPRIDGVQLVRAEMTDDLQLVKIYYYVDGTADDKKRALKGLTSAKGYFKRAIAGRMDLRLVPDIKFYFDEGIDKAEKLDEIFKEIDREVKE